jgi:hypothetical protein
MARGQYSAGIQYPGTSRWLAGSSVREFDGLIIYPRTYRWRASSSVQENCRINDPDIYRWRSGRLVRCGKIVGYIRAVMDGARLVPCAKFVTLIILSSSAKSNYQLNYPSNKRWRVRTSSRKNFRINYPALIDGERVI